MTHFNLLNPKPRPLLSLIVKGERLDALETAFNHHIPTLGYPQEVPTAGKSTVLYTTEAHRPKVASWYCEPATLQDGFGFPPGTLLLYSTLKS